MSFQSPNVCTNQGSYQGVYETKSITIQKQGISPFTFLFFFANKIITALILGGNLARKMASN